MKINLLESAKKEIAQFNGKSVRIYQAGAG